MARIEKRGKSWRITVSLGYDSNNKQIRATKTINDIGYTKTEVKKMASEFELEVSRKKFTNDKNLTLSDFIGYWEKEYALQDGVYSPTTIARNKNLLARIIPALGHIRLSKLKPTHLISFYNYLREEDVRADGKKGFLSSRTIQMHHKLLSSILNKAKKWQFLEENPCHYVDAPKSKSKQATVYDSEELNKFLTLLFEKALLKYQAFFLIAFSTGLRRGEILGLRWSDIDFENAIIKISQNAITVKGGIEYKDPKTEKSAGSVSLSKTVIPILLNLQKEQKDLKYIHLGKNPNDKWNEYNLIFINKYGKAMYPSSFAHWLVKFTNNNNLPPISIHAFRHMSVTYAIDQGYDLKSVSERARHSKIGITADIYGHYFPQKDQAIANSLDKFIQNAQINTTS